MSWQIAGRRLKSRLFLGTAQYPSLATLQQAVAASKAEVITLSLRRQSPEQQTGNTFWESIKALGCHLLPNTAGCRTAKEAITTALMAREIFATDWIKLEVIGDDYTLQPDPFELLIAAKELMAQGFQVFPYCTEDLIVCERLVDAGCQILMPWAAPIGTGKGLLNPYALQALRQRFPKISMLIDAGIGAPSHAVTAMEWGFDGVLINSAVAMAEDPVYMAKAFALAVEAGRLAYRAGVMPMRNVAQPSTPLIGRPFWQQESVDG